MGCCTGCRAERQAAGGQAIVKHCGVSVWALTTSEGCNTTGMYKCLGIGRGGMSGASSMHGSQ